MKKEDQKTDETQLMIITGTEELIGKAKTALIEETIGNNEYLTTIKEQYQNLVIGGIKDLEGYKVVKAGSAELKKLRVSIDKRRKELTEPALSFQRELKAEADRVIDFIKPIEEHLNTQKTNFENLEKAEENKKFTERAQLLAQNGYQLAGSYYVCGALQVATDGLGKLDENAFNFYIQQGEAEMNRQKAEAERKEREKQELDDARAEIAKAREELAAQREALEQKYGAIETPVETESPEDVPAMEISHEMPPLPRKTDEKMPYPTEAPVESETTDEISEFTAGFMAGFDDMKQRVVDLLSGAQKFTRPQIIEFCQTQKPESHVDQ